MMFRNQKKTFLCVVLSIGFSFCLAEFTFAKDEKRARGYTPRSQRTTTKSKTTTRRLSTPKKSVAKKRSYTPTRKSKTPTRRLNSSSKSAAKKRAYVPTTKKRTTHSLRPRQAKAKDNKLNELLKLKEEYERTGKIPNKRINVILTDAEYSKLKLSSPLFLPSPTDSCSSDSAHQAPSPKLLKRPGYITPWYYNNPQYSNPYPPIYRVWSPYGYKIYSPRVYNHEYYASAPRTNYSSSKKSTSKKRKTKKSYKKKTYEDLTFSESYIPYNMADYWWE